MKNALISFGSDGYENGLQGLKKSAQTYFDDIVLYKKNDVKHYINALDARFYDISRGYHLWTWKPYLILETFKQNPQVDIVFYCDSLLHFINNPKLLFEKVDQNKILLFDQIHINRSYTKRDCFILMNCDKEEFHNTRHLNAAFCLFKRSEEAFEFLNDWQKYCCCFDIVSDKPSIYGPELPEFIMHRHDQSILTNLSKKYNLHTYRSLCQWGVEWGSRADSEYPQIIHHHRSK